MRDEVWIEPDSPLHRLGRRAATSVSARSDRVNAWLRSLVASAPARGLGPKFPLSGFHASFSELEAITFHPDVLAAIEQAPRAAFDTGALPAPRLPSTSLPAGPARRRAVRIVDLVPFGLELDVLELRLAHLYDVVDAFVVVESTRGYGGVAKPLVLQRNLPRFARFEPKLHPIAITSELSSTAQPSHREGTDWSGEMAFRAAMWHAARPLLSSDTETIVIASDCDELPPRHLLHWIRHHDVQLPMRVRVPTLRFNLGWQDPRVFADIVLAHSAQFAEIDRDPGRLRTWPGPTFGVRGGVHVTSFLSPLAMIAKFAITTDWEEGVVPFIRNAHDETATMMAHGHWFGRPMRRYDSQTDARGMIPEALRLHGARFAHLWPTTGSRRAVEAAR